MATFAAGRDPSGNSGLCLGPWTAWLLKRRKRSTWKHTECQQIAIILFGGTLVSYPVLFRSHVVMLCDAYVGRSWCQVRMMR